MGHTINTYGANALSNVYGMGVVPSQNLYYIMDNGADKIVVFDINWSYVNAFPFVKPRYMVATSTDWYLSATGGIFRLDFSFNTISSLSTGASICYNDLDYSASLDYIYAVSLCNQSINIFTRDLQHMKSVTVFPNPWSVTLFNGFVYVGTYGTNIVKYDMDLNLASTSIIYCTSGTISTFQYDSYGYLAVGCLGDYAERLYDASLASTGLSLTSATSIYSLKFSLNGSLIHAGGNTVKVYV